MWEKINQNRLLAGVAGFLAIALFIEMQGLPSFGSKDAKLECQNESKSSVPLSETQLVKLINLKQGDSKASVRSLLKEPYCQLPTLEARKDAPSERDVYLVKSDDFLQFDPRTRIVVLYEGEQYMGYRFWVR